MQPDIHYQLTGTDGRVTHIELHQEPENHGLAVDPDFVPRTGPCWNTASARTAR
ncbi:hypothetical protein HML84_15660 [Alcanivorax sp. IO_7]|nr:hypothetical protein HML84_15660 [Alcanivorax sp. IO_7]